mmetsp:Transcript_20781/g.48229  ORF Transcript_20781/g.48229 Transcript_20781/m.48229 type:complete len:85 (+) Transcript_20781:1246-1500(+)
MVLAARRAKIEPRQADNDTCVRRGVRLHERTSQEEEWLTRNQTRAYLTKKERANPMTLFDHPSVYSVEQKQPDSPARSQNSPQP